MDKDDLINIIADQTNVISLEEAKARHLNGKSNGSTVAIDNSEEVLAYVETLLALKSRDLQLAELSKLSTNNYNNIRLLFARKIHWQASVLDEAVSKLKPAVEEADAPLHPHWVIEPWDHPVNTLELVHELNKKIITYVAAMGDSSYVVALWVMFTWVHEDTPHSPSMLLWSPVGNCGKSTLLTVTKYLTYRSIKSVLLTGAALFRSIEKWHPTVIIDEADTNFVKNDDLRAVFNSGWTRDDVIIRINPDSREPEAYSTFCPKAVGMVGKKIPDTTRSRCISIEMKRKTLDEKTEDFENKDDEEFTNIRRKLLRWSVDNKNCLRKRPQMISGFTNRVACNWRPLLSIAELAGTEIDSIIRRVAQRIESQHEDDESALAIELLKGIYNTFKSEEKDELSTKRLLGMLISDEEQPWCTYSNGKPMSERQLGRLLSLFSIISENIGEKNARVKGYKKSRFEEMFERYVLPKITSVKDTSETQADVQVNSGERQGGFADPSGAQAVVRVNGKIKELEGGLAACVAKSAQTNNDYIHKKFEYRYRAPQYLRDRMSSYSQPGKSTK